MYDKRFLVCVVAMSCCLWVSESKLSTISYHKLLKDKLIQQLMPDCNIKCKPTAIAIKFHHKMIIMKHYPTSVVRANKQ